MISTLQVTHLRQSWCLRFAQSNLAVAKHARRLARRADVVDTATRARVRCHTRKHPLSNYDTRAYWNTNLRNFASLLFTTYKYIYMIP